MPEGPGPNDVECGVIKNETKESVVPSKRTVGPSCARCQSNVCRERQKPRIVRKTADGLPTAMPELVHLLLQPHGFEGASVVPS